MEPVTPRRAREAGLVYPLPLRDEVLARAVPQIERFLPAGADPLIPFADDEPIPVLFRFPSPRGLLDALARDAFALAPPDVDAAFFGDLATNFAYPWVAEFGTLAVLDPVRLSPYRVRARPGGFVCDAARVVPKDAHLFVPDRPMAERLEPGMSRDDALDAIGRDDWSAAVAERRARAEAYVEALPSLDARRREILAVARQRPDGVRGALAPLGLAVADLEGPLFALSASQRAALIDLRVV